MNKCLAISAQPIKYNRDGSKRKQVGGVILVTPNKQAKGEK